MKLKDGFILRTVAGETVVLPAGGVTDFDMMITLNDTGRFLWELLEKDPQWIVQQAADMMVAVIMSRDRRFTQSRYTIQLSKPPTDAGNK